VSIVPSLLASSLTPPLLSGDFAIDDCIVEAVSNAECNAPAGAYPFKIINFSTTGTEYLYCYVTSEELRLFFALVLLCKARQTSIRRDLSRLPEPHSGWLRKEGHFMRSWKKRFFVLNCGHMKYFDTIPTLKPGGEGFQGKELGRSDIDI
jgi:hypothetical protein